MSVNKITTDNISLLDNLMYYLKEIATEIVLKDDKKSLETETSESTKKSDLYIHCIEGTARLELFDLYANDFIDIGIPLSNIDTCVKDPKSTPEPFKTTLLNKCVSEYMDNYIELNEYYRMLNGLPPLDEVGIKVPSEFLTHNLYKVDLSKYIHEMTRSEQDVLLSLGIIDKLLQEYPDHKYLRRIGSKSISVYEARKADKFQLLYLPSDIPEELNRRFIERVELNRIYTLQTIYSDAYKYGSTYYDNFIMMFIVIQTMIDILAEMPDMIIRNEMLDIKMVELIFQSSCIDFFPEIPMKYQVAMVKNINRLIKYKSTTKNIVDICSLFGFDNIEIFKYYLLKQRKVDDDGNYVFKTKEIEVDSATSDGTSSGILDQDACYELKFLKVPMDDIADNYINNKKQYLDYDETTNTDPYWDGDMDHEIVKSIIVNKEFNYLQSKYLSVDTVYSMSEVSFQMIYFYNMLFDNVDLEEELTLRVPSINPFASFKLVDLLCYLFALGYNYYGLKDTLMDTMGKILTIKGFNFNANMQELGTYVAKKGYTLEQLGVADFQIPTSPIMTFDQLMYIFTKNKQVYDHVVMELRTANNKQIYDIYKKLYDSLLLMDLTMDFFKKPDGNQSSTYTEFISVRDEVLYNSLMSIKNIDNEEVRKQKIAETIGDAVYVLEDYIQTDKYKYLFMNLPAVSAEAIKQYIFKVVNFFKSYKMQILSLNTIYKFDDRLDNRIEIIDSVLINYIYNREDTIELIEKLTTTVNITKEERDMIIDKLYIQITHIFDLFFNDKIDPKEKLSSIEAIITYKDDSGVEDNKLYKSILPKIEFVDIIEKALVKSMLNYKESSSINDKIYITITNLMDLALETIIQYRDKIYMQCNMTYDDQKYELYSGMFYNSKFDKSDSVFNRDDSIFIMPYME